VANLKFEFYKKTSKILFSVFLVRFSLLKLLMTTIILISCTDKSGDVSISQSNNTLATVEKTLNDTTIPSITPTFKIINGFGNQEPIFRDGLATDSFFFRPEDLIQDQGTVYIADTQNHRIRKIDKNNNVTTIAGNGNHEFGVGVATDVGINFPHALAIDSMQNIYFLARNSTINKLTKNGIVSQIFLKPDRGFTGNILDHFQFRDIIVDKEDNLYVVDNKRNVILKVLPTGLTSIYAGNGHAGYKEGYRTDAQFNNPQGIAINSKGEIFVSDALNYRIRKIDLNGQVSTYIGNGSKGYTDGKGSDSQIKDVYKLVFNQNDVLYFLDPFNYALRKVSENGEVSTVLKNPVLKAKDSLNAFMNFWGGIEVGKTTDSILIADRDWSRIRQLNQNSSLETFAGAYQKGLDGLGKDAIFSDIYDIAVNSKGLVFTSTLSGIKKIDQNNYVTSLDGFDQKNKEPFIYKHSSIDINSEDELIVTDELGNKIYRINNDGSFLIISDSVVNPIKAIEDDFGNVFILEKDRHHILRLDRNNQLNKFAGNPLISGDKIGNVNSNNILFNQPKDLAFDKEGNLLVVDSKNGKIKSIDREGNVSELSGYFKNHLGETIRTEEKIPLLFRQPISITVDNDNEIFVVSYDGLNYISKDRRTERITLTEIFSKPKLDQESGIHKYRSVTSDQENNIYLAMTSSITPLCVQEPQNCDLSRADQIIGFGFTSQNNYVLKIKVQKK
jgi:hypothetical protein